MIGTTLAHYRITEQLGKGGMGEVYRATDTKLNRDVALKILPESFAQDPHRLGRFEREAQVLASLNHPNIAAVHGVEEQDGRHALVMELVEGEDLSQRIERGPIPLEDALPIALQIAEGLEDAHEKGIIHRDLKPANVRITPEGKVKILDFGLAKALEGDRSEQDPHLSQSPTLTMAATQAGIILGTAAYMSPEQARGRPVDKRTDIWAFGAVLFEMLSGQKVFQGEDLSVTLASVIKDNPEWEKLPERLPGQIYGLVERCLRKDPRSRIRDIGDARVTIEDYLANPSDQATVGGTSPTTVQPSWQRTLPWALLGLVCMAFLVSLGMWPDVAEPEPSRRLSIELGADVELGPLLGPSAILSPDGSLMAFVGLDGVASRRIFIRRMDQLEATPLAGTEGVWNPTFSPDGEWIAFRADQQLKKISVRGGAALTLCDAPNTRGISWGENGSIVFGLNGSQPLFRVSSAGGTPQPLTTLTGGDGIHQWPQVLPGAEEILFTAHNRGGDYDNASVVIGRLSDGKTKVIVQGGYQGRYLPTGHLVYLHQGSLFAVPFDLDTWETRGSASPILEGVLSAAERGWGHWSFSQKGSLLYLDGLSATNESTLDWLTREGERHPLLAKPARYGSFSLSPDGQRLAVEIHAGGQWDLWIHDLQRETMTRLTFDPASDWGPVWSPGGGTIVFSSQRTGVWNLYWKRSDGSGETHRLTESSVNQLPTSWHPSGDYLALQVNPGGQEPDIHILSLEGDDRSGWNVSDTETFVETPSFEAHASFSPDGGWLAYTSIVSGAPQIYVKPFPGPGGKWQISSGGGARPQWAPGENVLSAT